MTNARRYVATGVVLVALLFAQAVSAQFAKNEPCPDIQATDIHGKEVNLEKILGEDRALVILFFFSVQTSEDLALKLDALNQGLGGKEIEIVALGLQDDAEALKAFAERMGIDYYIISRETLEEAAWRDKVSVLPTTLFVMPLERKIERVLSGDSERNRNILTQVAENFFQQRREAAAAIADQAIQEGEDAADAREVKGFILAAEGKLDEAEAEFGAIDSKAGLSKVAYERGDYDKALEIAEQAPEDGYAQTVKAQVQMKTGKLEEAAASLEGAAEKSDADWQRSEALNAKGRLDQATGDPAAAINSYENAVSLDPYNVVALSNEGAAHREQGDLDKAQEVLEKASRIRDDSLVDTMLAQIQKQLKEANDIEKRKLINSQIADLAKRYEEMKTAPDAAKSDEWTTRPLVLAFLPSSSSSPAFFERAGTDVVLQREIEGRLQQSGHVAVVEREMLDQLLQELNLGSSELASSETQRRLGQVLSAGMLGFMDFVQMGASPAVYLRLVDTETTAIALQTSQPIDEDQPLAAVDALVTEIADKLQAERSLQGFIADASDETAIIINLGRAHGIQAGQEFVVLQDGDPIEVNGKVIAYKQRPVAKLTVSAVEDDYAVCTLANKSEGVVLAKEMKVRASKAGD